MVAVITRLDIPLNHPISAASALAIASTCITVDVVAIIALLSSLEDPIAAAGEGAIITTLVVVDLIAVITGLIPLHDPITALGGRHHVGRGPCVGRWR